MKRRCPKCRQYFPLYDFRPELGSVCEVCEVEAARAKHAALPCLNSNNCIGNHAESMINSKNKQLPEFHERFKSEADKESAKLNEFSTSHKKSATALELNVHQFIETFGLNHVGFLTLTFADDVQDVKEASRRFHSLRTNFLSKHFRHYICVYERTKKGRIHFHLIVNTREDIRRGLNFAAIAARNYTSANPALRQLWKLIRENVGKYGFGRSELLPVKTNSKGLARYVAKYIAKHIDSRIPEDKGYRLIRTTIDKKSLWKIATSNFSFRSVGSAEWRRKLQNWVIAVEPYLKRYAVEVKGYEIPDIDEDNYNTVLSEVISPKWAFLNREIISNMP
ncbi:MAG: phasyl DNA replicon protein arp [Neisseria zoodegmatis]|uniref:rolling circle replication-associated protein n=1 Tax=Neisseria zoodegmatis TaxID=326523 RepID=UPI0026EC6615|nr:phasyl DNA replicon protein arp [Neisseria zoodegmatis]MDO5070551.1 phasyl DNA replicon protein arp [Neisseria zoodegmatis]